VQAVVGERPAQVVAIDGKTSRGSADRSRGQAALHLVSAWATASGLVLGQEATDAKSNEITAIPRLLRLLALDGCVVTMDAMGGQRTIAAQLQEQGADYVLALKGNQPTLHATVAAAFAETHTTAAGAWQPVEQDAAQTLDGGHGRVERRRYTALSDPDLLACLDPTGAWPGLRAVIEVQTARRPATAPASEQRYYLASLPPDAARLGQAIRAHWCIENRVHWVLDVQFREDASADRVGEGAHTFTVLRQLALNLIRQDHTARGSIASKRFRAALDDTYLARLLAGLAPSTS